VKVLTLIVKKVDERNIRKTPELIRLYTQMSDMDGQLSAYMSNWVIWVDGCRPILLMKRDMWILSVYLELDFI
jgi:hypothetical protein